MNPHPSSSRGRILPLLALGLGSGALVGAAAGWLRAGAALGAARERVQTERWSELGLDRLVALELDGPVAAITWTVLASAGLGLAITLVLAAMGRRSATGSRGLPVWVVRNVGLLVLAGALLAEANRVGQLESSAEGRPNVVWIVIDALRADHLGCYGYELDTSPFMDSLASQGARFERALSQESYTMASAASYFTSLYPPQTGVLYDKPDIDALDLSFVTLAEVLKDAGYDTGAFVFNPHLHAKYQFGQGFDVYDDSYPHLGDGNITEQSALWEGYETVRPMHAKVTAFLEDGRFDRSTPKFLYLHYRDVHGPYIPPPEYVTMFMPESFAPELKAYIQQYQGRSVARQAEPDDPPMDAAIKGGNWPWNPAGLPYVLSQYDGEIRYNDDGIRRLFDLLAEHGITPENSVIVITADHGEEFLDPHPGDTPEWNHGRTLYLEQVNVPLLVSLPEQWGTGRVVPQPVELVDIGPTVLDAVGLAERVPEDFVGRSLVPLLEGKPLSSRPVFSGGNHGRGLVLGDGLAYYHYETATKLQRARNYYGKRPGEDFPYQMDFQLYDVDGDLAQTVDLLQGEQLSPEMESRARDMRQLLRQWIARKRSSTAPRLTVDPDEEAHLRALGYLGEDDDEQPLQKKAGQ